MIVYQSYVLGFGAAYENDVGRWAMAFRNGSNTIRSPVALNRTSNAIDSSD